MTMQVAFSFLSNDGDPIIIATNSSGMFMGIVDEDETWTPVEASLRVEYLNHTYAGTPALQVWRELWPTFNKRPPLG